jgi:hypothetical protein
MSQDTFNAKTIRNILCLKKFITNHDQDGIIPMIKDAFREDL